jgi:hypothetical protein
LSRFYVSEERAGDIQERLSYPACPADDYVHITFVNLQQELHELQQIHHETVEELGTLERETEALRHDLLHWRRAALESWANAVASGAGEDALRLHAELEAMRQTVSWRVTRPLRAVRSRMGTHQ